MKNRIITILLCSILVLSITGCGNKQEESTKNINSNTNNDVKEEKTEYSKCAKEENKCTEEEIKSGQLVKVELNSKETEEFYVIADDGSELTLIMNGTYGIKTPFVSSDDIKNVCGEEDGKSCGPYTATKSINEATKNWTSISNIKNYEYNMNTESDTKTYKSLKINNGVTTIVGNSGKEYTVPGDTKARLATSEEITDLKASDWIRKKVEEMYDAKEIKHFYALTATASYGGYDGTVLALTCKYKTGFTRINVDNELVVMPVITISKSKIK